MGELTPDPLAGYGEGLRREECKGLGRGRERKGERQREEEGRIRETKGEGGKWKDRSGAPNISPARRPC